MKRVCPCCSEIDEPIPFVQYLNGNTMEIKYKYQCPKCKHFWLYTAPINTGNIVSEN